MRKALRHFHMFLLVCFIVVGGLQAQDKTITGNVVGEDNLPLPGVNIIIKGTSTGAVTDIEGNFSISVATGDVLIFSFIGYEKIEVPITTQSVLDITLYPDITSLQEVLVIGYGEQRKEDATGAVAAIGSKDFNKAVISAPQGLIAGKIAGVNVTSNDGTPGGGSTIRIRGGSSMSANNDPLIVIDGFPIDNTNINGMSNALALLNPQDIESMTVLKDASATAIYGSRASNGVIMITTKKGKEGKKLQTSYTGTFSLGTPIEYVDVFTGDEYRELLNQLVEAGTVPGLNVDALDRVGSENTDWQDLIYQNAFSMDHNVSVTGAIPRMPYRVSYGFTDQDGILKTTNMKRHTINAALDPSFFNDMLKINVNWKSMFYKQNFGNTGAIGSAVAFDPTQPVRHGNERWGGYFYWANLADDDPNTIGPANPVALLEQTENTSNINRHIGNIKFDYSLHFLPELSVVLNMGFDRTRSEGKNYNPNDAAFTFRNGIGSRTDYTQDLNSELLDFYLNYNNEFGIHRLDITGGYSYQHFKRENFNYARNGFEAGDESYIKNDSSINAGENFLVSFFGRVNYTIKDRYLITATVRGDGTSRFSKDNRWGVFPAFAFGWKINEEAFLENSSVVSQLKLRLGYGVTGQQDILPGSNLTGSFYPYIPVYTISQPTAQYQLGNTFSNTRRPEAYDANIKWEETVTYNIGLDFGFLDDKVSGAVEFYKRETKDLINFIPIAAGSNFSNFLNTNVGNLENEGIELTLTYHPITTPDLQWTVGFNMAYNQNKITKLTLTDDPSYAGVDVGFISGGNANTIQNHQVGFPANSFYVFQQVYDDNGRPIEGLYVDRTGQGGQISGNNLNKYHWKYPNPDFIMGLNTSLIYKNLDFSFSGRFHIGNYVYNNNKSEKAHFSRFYDQSGFFSNALTAVSETNFVNPQFFSDHYIENASFFKMDNISLGYNFGSIFTEKLRLRASFTVQNAFVITNYTGLDPEVGNIAAAGGQATIGIDNNIYPRPRTYLLGINLTY